LWKEEYTLPCIGLLEVRQATGKRKESYKWQEGNYQPCVGENEAWLVETKNNNQPVRCCKANRGKGKNKFAREKKVAEKNEV